MTCHGDPLSREMQMTRPDWIETLRADVRPADPDPVLLTQLVQLSRGSVAPAPRPGRSVGVRLAVALGGAIAVGATSWAAGALPGTDSPFRPEEQITHQPTGPSPGNVGTPQPDDSASPAGEPTPSSPAGDPGRSTPADSTDIPGHAGDPPGMPAGRPDMPGPPEMPEVPTVPPPGLDNFPEQRPVGPPDQAGVPEEPKSDSGPGRGRSPQPRIAQVAPAP